MRKTCSKCGESKDLALFYRQASRSDGYASWCKSCSDENRAKNRKSMKRRRIATPATKVCSKCKVEKRASDFTPLKGSGDGLYSYCKACKAEMVRAYVQRNPEEVRRRARERKATPSGRLRVRKSNLKQSFGISKSEFDRKWRDQGKTCAICGARRRRGEPVFALDHDHATGMIRGILCHNCNRALGLANDDIRLLERAIKYLGRTAEK